MRVIEIIHAITGNDVLVRVQHRKFLVEWVAEYKGMPTIFKGVYNWYRRGSDKELRSTAMCKFLDDAMRKEN